MKKILFILTIIVLMVGGGYYFKDRLPGDEQRQGARRTRPAAVVETVQVTRADIRDLGRYTGGLTASAEFIIAPRITGRLKELLVGLGDRVARGQLVARIVDEEYLLQVEQAEAAVDVAKANLAEAEANLALSKSEHDRAKSLGGKKIVTKAEIEAVQAKLQGAEAKKRVAQAIIVQKQAAAKEARIKLSFTQLHASWTGGSDHRLIGQKFKDEGSLLPVGAPLVTIMEMNPLIGVINVIEKDFVRLKIDQTVTVTVDALPNRKFSGRVLRVSPYIEKESRQGRVELEIYNPEMVLKPGMFIRAELEFDRHRGVIVIPASALINRRDKTGVFMVHSQGEESIAKFVVVEPGLEERGKSEIISPQLEGQVIVLGHHLLTDGAKIRVIDRSKEVNGSKPDKADQKDRNKS